MKNLKFPSKSSKLFIARLFRKLLFDCFKKIEGNIKIESTEKSIEIIKKAFTLTPPTRLTVNGAEDMLVLPVCIHAPQNSVVLYGQHTKGLVLVEITAAIRNKAQTLLDMMK